jgi:hypothetical protein
MYADNALSNLSITAGQGRMKSIQESLIATVGGLAFKSITLPDWCNWFRIYPSTACRAAINESPAAIGSATWCVGISYAASEWNSRTLESGKDRTLQVTSAATGATVIVEVY